MGKFFFVSLVFSLVYAVFSGRLPQLSAAVLGESAHAVTLSLGLLGSLCFWSGIMKVAEKSGLTGVLCRILTPVLGLVFPKIKHDPAAMGAVSMNVSANLLGLGNAATPFGIAAMKELHRISGFSSSATREMVCFAVMNTASLQLIPATVAALRLEHGLSTPFDILPAVWLVSACSLLVGLLVAKLFYPEGKGL